MAQVRNHSRSQFGHKVSPQRLARLMGALHHVWNDFDQSLVGQEVVVTIKRDFCVINSFDNAMHIVRNSTGGPTGLQRS